MAARKRLPIGGEEAEEGPVHAPAAATTVVPDRAPVPGLAPGPGGGTRAPGPVQGIAAEARADPAHRHAESRARAPGARTIIPKPMDPGPDPGTGTESRENGNLISLMNSSSYRVPLPISKVPFFSGIRLFQGFIEIFLANVFASILVSIVQSSLS